MRRLVFLHGFTGSPEVWEPVLADLPPNAAVSCPAIVGHDPSLPLTATSFVDEVDRLAAACRRASWQPAHLVGYSLGGRLALGLLVRYRELFTSATLVGAHPGLEDAGERNQRRIADETLAHKLEEEGLEAFIDDWQDLPLFASQSSLPSPVLAAQRARRLEHRPEGLAHALRVLSLGNMPSFRADLERIDPPVQWLVGGLDTKFQRLATEMSTRLGGSEVQIVDGVGHNVVLEAPEVVARVVSRYA